MMKKWNHTKKVVCSRCLKKIELQETCYCESCNKETFGLPFEFVKTRGLQREYQEYVDNYLKKKWVKD